MSITINQVEGCYVSSSLPKALMIPIYPKQQKFGKTDKIKKISSTQLENVLYAKARKSGKYAKTKSRSFGDAECPPVFGRQHITVQTDLYLEELCDVIEEIDEQCQTDPLLDKPPSPLFVPAKIGVDAETQILPGELFDFDMEVQPLLEALIGQTLEQSLIEIVAEEELALLIDQRKEFELRRNTELAERQRLEEQERRLLEERQRRLQEQEEAIKLEEETTEKIAACVFAQNYLKNLLPSVYKRLEVQGYFATQEPEIQEVEENFWPWLMDEVDNELMTLEASCRILDSIIEDAVTSIDDTSVIRPVSPDVFPERELYSSPEWLSEEEKEKEVEINKDEGESEESTDAVPGSDI